MNSNRPTANNTFGRGRDPIDMICRALCVLMAMAGVFLALFAWWQGALATLPRVALYGVFPASVAVVCLGIQFLSPSSRKLLCVYGGAVAAAVLGAEVYLAYDTAEQTLSQQVSASRPVDPFAENPNAVPPVCSTTLMRDESGVWKTILAGEDGGPLLPLAGVSHRMIARSVGGNVTAAKSDRHGFNNPDRVWDASGQTQVLLIGDSFTYGADVPFGLGFSDLVREQRPGTVNLGCGGNGPLAALAALMEYGWALKPKIVVWAYYEGNDLTKDVLREYANPLLARYLETTAGDLQNLSQRQQEIDHAVVALIEDRRAERTRREQERRDMGKAQEPAQLAVSLNPREILGLVNLRTRLGLSFGIKPAAMDLASRTVGRMADVTGEWGGRLVVLHLPSETRWTNALAEADAAGFTDTVRGIVLENDGVWVSAADAFESLSADPTEFFAGHYSERGYRVVAETLLEQLKNLED